MKIISLILAVALPLSGEVFQDPPVDLKPKIEAVGCFLERDNGQILFLHRQDHKAHGNQWAIPGGKLDDGETPILAAAREVKEETGIILPLSSISPLQTVYIKINEHYHLIYHMVKTFFNGPIPIVINPNEHKGFTWITPQDSLKMDLMLDEDTCIKLIYPEADST